MSRISFEKKLVVITGAASGLGRELAKRMAVVEKADLVVADLDLDMIREVRNVWQFFRDRRPESYAALIAP